LIDQLRAAASVWARAGASVVLTGRKKDELKEAEDATRGVATDQSAKIISVMVDVANESDVQNLYAEIQKTFGRPADALINNAGVTPVLAPLGQVPWDNFTAVVSSHFIGSA
jgi:NAD(P)-dependent dehydrogenase (short-subunit alcohol dehydrogenase family)